MPLTDTEELILVITVVILMKVAFVTCMCKIQRCSQHNFSVPLTPGAVWKHLCCRKTDTDATTQNSEAQSDTPRVSEPVKPPPYTEQNAPPLYEDGGTPPPMYENEDLVCVSVWEPPPPYLPEDDRTL